MCSEHEDAAYVTHVFQAELRGTRFSTGSGSAFSSRSSGQCGACAMWGAMSRCSSTNSHGSGSVSGSPSQPVNQTVVVEAEQTEEAPGEPTPFEQSVDNYLRSVRRKVSRRQEKVKRQSQRLSDRRRLREALQVLMNEHKLK